MARPSTRRFVPKPTPISDIEPGESTPMEVQGPIKRPPSEPEPAHRKPDGRTRVQLAPGEKIPGTDYLIVRWAGDSELGPTYEASRSGKAGTRVSLKVFTNDVGGDVRSVKMGKAEARVASGLKSPYITQVIEFSELSDGRLFQVIELVEGKRLADLVGDADPARVVGILRQVCKGLAAAHSVGVVHGDVKPDNIWLIKREGREDSVKITDFGIASLVGQDAADAPPRYMAPERLDGAGREPAADMYAVGCVAYELLTGVPPFNADDPEQVRKAHRDSKPAPMSVVTDREIPPALEKVVLRCLAKKPAERYANMQDLEAALCEAQIEAGLRSHWDHLPVPGVDAARKKKIENGMPEPLARLSPAVEEDDEEEEELETQIYSESMLADLGEDLGDSRTEPVLASPEREEKGGPPAWIYAAAGLILLGGVVAMFSGGGDEPTDAAPAVARAEGSEPGAKKPIEPHRGGRADDADSPRERVAGSGAAGSAPPGPGDTGAAPANPAVAGDPAADGPAVDDPAVDDPAVDDPAVVGDSAVGDSAAPPEAGTGGEDGSGEAGGEDADPEGGDPVADDAVAGTPDAAPAPSGGGQSGRDPARANELAKQGQAAVRQGRREAGQKLFFRALEHDSRNHRALAGLSDLYFDQGSYSKAVTFAKRAVASSPGNAGYRMKLGDALFKVLKYAEARKQYEKADKLGHSGAKGRIAALDKKLGK